LFHSCSNCTHLQLIAQLTSNAKKDVTSTRRHDQPPAVYAAALQAPLIDSHSMWISSRGPAMRTRVRANGATTGSRHVRKHPRRAGMTHTDPRRAQHASLGGSKRRTERRFLRHPIHGDRSPSVRTIPCPVPGVPLKPNPFIEASAVTGIARGSLCRGSLMTPGSEPPTPKSSGVKRSRVLHQAGCGLCPTRVPPEPRHHGVPVAEVARVRAFREAERAFGRGGFVGCVQSSNSGRTKGEWVGTCPTRSASRGVKKGAGGPVFWDFQIIRTCVRGGT
jgi:hypothetical protein